MEVISKLLMEFKTSVCHDVNEKEWNRSLSKNKTATAYQIAAWPKIYEYAYESKPLYITVENNSGDILGQLAGVIHSKLFWQDSNIITSFIGSRLNLRSVLNWFYGPIIHDLENHEKIIFQILDKINEISKKEKITMARGISPPLHEGFSNKQFGKFGYAIEPWSTYITNLNLDSNALYNTFDKKTRYDIRKSEKNNLQFIVASSRSEFNEFYEIQISSEKRSGHKIKRNSAFYDAHWDLMHKKGFEKLFLVRYNGIPIGGLFGVIFNKNLIQHGVGNTETTQLLGGTFLTWNSLKWAINENLMHFDLGGANPNPELEKDRNIDHYKAKWGGIKYPYFLYSKIFSQTKTNISSLLKNPKNIHKKIYFKT